MDNNYVHYYGFFYGHEGPEATRTSRKPDHKFTNNLFRLEYWEWRIRATDYMYQIYRRLHRSNDGWTRCLIGYTAFSFLMFNQALFWKIQFGFFALFTASRIRDKGAEPTLDEVWLLDTIFANDKLRGLFGAETYHVIDYFQEFDEGLDNPYFPEYKTTLARFFNVDPNTTTGYYKIGDVESGAVMTLNFKTMPYANNKYNFTEPYMVYDMWAGITYKGRYWEERLIKAEEVLRTKRIFVIWH